MINIDSIGLLINQIKQLAQREERYKSGAQLFFKRYSAYLESLAVDSPIEKQRESLAASINIFKDLPEFSNHEFQEIFDDIIKNEGKDHKTALNEDEDFIPCLFEIIKQRVDTNQPLPPTIRTGQIPLKSPSLLAREAEKRYEKQPRQMQQNPDFYQNTIQEILLEALENLNAPLLEEALAMRGEEKPRQKVVEEILARALKKKQWPIVDRILKMDRDNKPSQASIEKTLEVVTSPKMSSNQLKIAQFILQMIGDNKPNQVAVETTLKKRVWENSDKLTMTILEMELENKPSRGAVDEKFKRISEHLSETNLVMIEKILTMEGENKPSQEAVEFVLIQGVSDINQETQKRVVSNISAMTGDNKPRPEVMNIVQAIYKNQPDKVQELFDNYKEMLPNNLVDFILHYATLNNRADLVKDLLSMSGKNQPSVDSVEACLHAAAQLGFVPIVQQFMSMTGDNAPAEEEKEQYMGLVALPIATDYNPSSLQDCLNLYLEKAIKLNRLSPGIFNNSTTRDNLSKAIEEAKAKKGMERLIFMDLGWMDREGQFTSNTPQVILDMAKPSSSNESTI